MEPYVSINLGQGHIVTLLARSEGRVEQRSAFGVGKCTRGTGGDVARIFTHPVDATLDHPPFCKQNGGF